MLALALALTAAGTGVPCGPPRADTLAVSPAARVYRTPRGDFGCRRGGGRVRLNVDDGQEAAQLSRSPIRFAGPFAAYVLRGAGYDGDIDYDLTDVTVTDLRSGRTLRAYAGHCTGSPNRHVTSLVLKRTGALAYICQRYVVRCDARGAVEIAGDADPGSLRLRGSRVVWSSRGSRHSTSLHGVPRGYGVCEERPEPGAYQGPPITEPLPSPAECAEPRSRTVLLTAFMRVYRVPTGRGGRSTVACNNGTGNRIQLDDAAGQSTAFKRPAMAAAGNTLAYAVELLDNDNNAGTTIRVVDTRKPDVTAQQEGRLARPAEAKVGSVVVTNRGDVAWIGCESAFTGTAAFGPDCLRSGAPDRVYLWPLEESKPRVVDSGRDIVPQSLRRERYRISWIAAERRRTAVFRR